MLIPSKEIKALSLFTAEDPTRPWSAKIGLYANDALVASDSRSIVIRGEIPGEEHPCRLFDPDALLKGAGKDVEVDWLLGEERSFLPLYRLVPKREAVACPVALDVYILEKLAKISRALGDKGASPWCFFTRGEGEPILIERVPQRHATTSRWTVIVYPYRCR